MAYREYDRVKFPTVIPAELKSFDMQDVTKTFRYMEKTFHLHRDWYNQFRQELLEPTPGVTQVEYFFRFAFKHLDPPLKMILRRKESVILSLCRYIIKDKARTKQNGNSGKRSYR